MVITFSKNIYSENDKIFKAWSSVDQVTTIPDQNHFCESKKASNPNQILNKQQRQLSYIMDHPPVEVCSFRALNEEDKMELLPHWKRMLAERDPGGEGSSSLILTLIVLMIRVIESLHAMFYKTNTGLGLAPLKKFMRLITRVTRVAVLRRVMQPVQGAARDPVHVPRVKLRPVMVKAQSPVPHGPWMWRLLGCQVKMSVLSATVMPVKQGLRIIFLPLMKSQVVQAISCVRAMEELSATSEARMRRREKVDCFCMLIQTEQLYSLIQNSRYKPPSSRQLVDSLRQRPSKSVPSLSLDLIVIVFTRILWK